jgi:hypothetical protein
LRKVPAMTGDVRTAIPIAATIIFRFVLIVDLPFAACGVPTIAANIVAAWQTEMFSYCIGEMRPPLSAEIRYLAVGPYRSERRGRRG